MEDKEKEPEAPRAYFPHNNFSSRNNLSYHFNPYGGSATFKNMKKKAEQALTDHEFKG